MVAAIGLLAIDAFFFPGNTSAQLWSYGFAAVFIIYAIIFKDALLGRFLLFVACAGFTELAADAWAVDKNTLYYPHNQPILWDSPAYMPFSWIVVLLQVGFIGYLISQKVKMVYASIIMILIGTGLVPLYDHLAITASWWHYQNTCMFWITQVPYYAIFAEGLLMGSVPPLFKKCETAPWWQIPLLGIFQGLLILVCVIGGFYIATWICSL
jgi:hypothetical protein